MAIGRFRRSLRSQYGSSLSGLTQALRGKRWPFGRFYAGSAGLQVTTAGRRSINVFVPRGAVVSVSVGKGVYGQRLKSADAAGV